MLYLNIFWFQWKEMNVAKKGLFFKKMAYKCNAKTETFDATGCFFIRNVSLDKVRKRLENVKFELWGGLKNYLLDLLIYFLHTLKYWFKMYCLHFDLRRIK